MTHAELYHQAIVASNIAQELGMSARMGALDVCDFAHYLHDSCLHGVWEYNPQRLVFWETGAFAAVLLEHGYTLRTF